MLDSVSNTLGVVCARMRAQMLTKVDEDRGWEANGRYTATASQAETSTPSLVGNT
jgi:hypothetical protein